MPDNDAILYMDFYSDANKSFYYGRIALEPIGNL
jgi:hypothetical protein